MWEGLEQAERVSCVGSMPPVLCIDISMHPDAFGVVGKSIKLKCSFTSSYPISDIVAVDWTYRQLNGGSTVTILHFQNKPYPILEGPFKDRIIWEGDVRRGDASISLTDLRLTDNGTLSCIVWNPPDVHGNVPQTKLTVTIENLFFQFNTVILLSALVFIPSALVSLLLLIRMRRSINRGRTKNLKWRKKSPIEESQDCVYDDNENTPLHPTLPQEQSPGCFMKFCLRCLDDSDED
ncbi:myelin protein zero-like protein 3 isoform X1 [Xenopus laevis]|uniref:Myelin protein zero-like protein 3 isoform X1 n=1 Tax=Xenopus laevis TaxID=8355 RepID=A0A8J1L413_XENLA|nr:myelin protein zero-like protein 3 isoform X1 [Xenopus laevis]